jgi:NAD(P)-dependent dehydrogenase (short-subunit alcohol dehydrogenase family)
VDPNQRFSLRNRVAVVIGGTGLLCGEMARGMASAGATVIVVGKNEEKGQATVKSMRELGFHADFVPCDATNRSELERLRDTIHDRYGQLHVVINGAGINSSTPFLQISEQELEQILNVNLKSVFLSCQIFGDYLVKQGQAASIINIGSASGLTPLSRVFTYSMSKAAVHNLTKNLAREWAELGIRVNVLVPGFIPAEQNRRILSPDRVAAIMNHTPMRRFGTPEELVGAVLLLASDAGRFITGTELVVDGGFHAMTI